MQEKAICSPWVLSYQLLISGLSYIPDSKVHGANMGPIWGRQDPGGPHVGPMNLAIWDDIKQLVMLVFLK